jgi:16S rRNA (uracil1498-N3)-methyltransferase
MHRFYLSSSNINGNKIEIVDPDLLHQLTRVLRVRSGSQAILFDGRSSTELVAEFTEITKNKVRGEIIERQTNSSEPTLKITLFQALPKQQARFEEILQHGTEVGISHFVPIISERTEAKGLRNFARLQRIMIEATEQSNRTRVPTLSEALNFDQALKNLTGTHIIGDSFGAPPLLSTVLPSIRNAKELGIWIGPEGGFTSEEIIKAGNQGIQPISLGPRILRLETAGLAISSAILFG